MDSVCSGSSSLLLPCTVYKHVFLACPSHTARLCLLKPRFPGPRAPARQMVVRIILCPCPEGREDPENQPNMESHITCSDLIVCGNNRWVGGVAPIVIWIRLIKR